MAALLSRVAVWGGALLAGLVGVREASQEATEAVLGPFAAGQIHQVPGTDLRISGPALFWGLAGLVLVLLIRR